MAWIEQDELTKRFGDSADSIAQYYPIAVAKLNALTCNALTDRSTSDTTGIVDGDGMTVRLSAWFTSVTQIATSSGKVIDKSLWSFNPNVTSDNLNDEDNEQFGNIIKLSTEYNTGEVFTVSGEHGFQPLPEELKNVLMALMSAYQNRADGTDQITSKSIEDVSVSQDSRSAETPESIALETNQPLVDKWSLCVDKYHIGTLSYPSKRWEPPYYIGSEERSGGSQHAIGHVM